MLLGQMSEGVEAQQSSSAASPQQVIPDAPRPQTTLGPVAPGKGSTGSEIPAPTPAADDSFQKPVGSTLPGSAAPASAATQEEAPELPAPGEGAQAIQTLYVHTNFVEVPFTVKDNKGHLVPGLTWRDVRVYENGLRQKMSVFTTDPVPMSVALVIDQSLPFDTMSRVNNALGALQGSFAPYDEVAVYTYNNGPRLQTAFTAGQSARLGAVLEQSKSTGRDGAMAYTSGPLSQNININDNDPNNAHNPLVNSTHGTSMSGIQNVPRELHTLNDAILEAAKATAKAERGRRRIIFVISDGKEYGSVAKTKDVIKYLQTNKIQVYATLVGDSSVEGLGFIDRIHIPMTMRDNILPAYTAATGGETYAEYRTRGIETSFSKITEEVRTQYTVGYQTTEPFIDGKYRTIEVKVMRPNLEVIAKKGYYPSANDARPMRPTTTTPATKTP
ncbi:VWA domain-containing protein [Granulicella sp. WH15]|nr:VWA domain-containing protein [Granulicella sp. WH15]